MSSSAKYQKRTPRRGRANRRIWTPIEDDMPLSLLAVTAPKSPKGRKKSIPQKRVTRAAARTPIATPADVINLDNTPESEEMLSNVNSKIGNFMQSGNFISSDEDETEMIKAKTNKKPSPNPFFISDDSDDDCKFVKQPVGTSNFDISKPSTSAGTSSIPSKDNKPEVLDDDIMVLVDTVLDKKSSNSSQDKQSPMKDIKSLEEYRKETEEMLKNASCLLDEIKTGRKAETEDKKEESSQKVTVGLCPICLDSLADRPVSVTVCGHIFCKECILHTAQTLKKCPTCRKAINSKKIHPIYF